MSANPLQATNLPALKSYLGIRQADVSEDLLLQGLLTSCDQVIRTWLKVTSWLPATTITEYPNGNNAETIRLRQKPVLSIASVYEDPTACAGQGPNDFAASTLLTPGVDYYLPWDMPDGSSASWTGQLKRLGTVWAGRWVYIQGLLTPRYKNSTGTIKVTYTYGWANGIPADISLAAQNLIAAFRAGANYGKALTGFSYKGYSPQFGRTATGFFTEEIKDLLPTYRRLLG